VKRALAILALAAAQTADVAISSLIVSKTAVVTGERVLVTVRWKNNGPDAAHGVVATLSSDHRAFVLTAAGTSNWPCEPASGADGFICRGAILNPGAQAEMVVTLLAPASAEPPTFALTAAVEAGETDPAPSNNAAETPFQLTSAVTRADLTISPAQQTHRAQPGEQVSIPLSVRNEGPDDALKVKAFLAFDPGTRIPVTTSGAGWTCSNATHSPWIAECQRDRIAAGASAPLRVVATMPAGPGSFHFAARVASERQSNEAASNATASASVQVGQTEEQYTRVLVPLIGEDVPGANGSLWRTEITALIDADRQIMDRRICTILMSCRDFPLRKPFDPRAAGFFLSNEPTGEFVYTRTNDASKLHINTRVFDVSRSSETAGSEIPVVRDESFRSSPISLLGIPASEQYRYTLRVYERDGSWDGRVWVRVFADQEATPRVAVIRTLATKSDSYPDPLAPTAYPGYLQLDLGQLLDVSGIQTLRVDVEAADPGLRLWSFVSATNNETHHVTTFSAQ
jgi:hypothetical protein